jgi:hypothetical protein
MALSGTEEWRSGFVVDKTTKAWVTTSSTVGATVRNGFLRDPDGRIVISVQSSTPTFRSVSNGTVSAGTDVVIPAPTLAVGDVMLAAIADRGANTDTITPPGGWSVVLEQVRGSVGKLSVFSKIATGSEPGSYTFVCSSSSTNAGAIMTIANASTVPVTAGATATVATGLHTSPGLASTNIGDLIVRIVSTAVGTLPLSWTWPTSTERVDFNSVGTGAGGLAMATIQAVGGSLGTEDATFAQSSSTTYAAITVAVR